MQLVKGHGVLAGGVPGEAAEQMVARLGAAGVSAFAVAETFLPRMEGELPVMLIRDLREDGLYAQTDAKGDIRTVPWPAVAAAFCTKRDAVVQARKGLSPQTTGDLEVMTSRGVLRPFHRVYRAEPRPPEAEILCTLLVGAQGGGLCALKFAEREVLYGYLGPSRAAGHSENFATFLRDVMRHCPHAFFPRSMREVAAGRKTHAVRIKDAADYDHYLKWVLYSLAHRRQAGG
jgi:hypothetical protein